MKSPTQWSSQRIRRIELIFGLVGLAGLGVTDALIITIHHLLWYNMKASGRMSSNTDAYLLAGAEAILAIWFWGRLSFTVMKSSKTLRQLRRTLHPVLVPWVSHAIPLAGGTRCFLSPSNERYAFCLGYFRPAIIVSLGLWNALNAQERDAVVLHEYHHARAWDALTQTFMQGIFQVAPIKGLDTLFHQYLVLREIRADAFAVDHNQGGITALASAMRTALYASATDDSLLGWSESLEARVNFMATGELPAESRALWIQAATSSLLGIAVAVGQGIVFWCR